MKQLTKVDPVLKEVFYFTHRGWPEDVPEDWKPEEIYFQKRDEISIEDGILFTAKKGFHFDRLQTSQNENPFLFRKVFSFQP